MEIHWLKVVGTLARQQALELSMYYKSWPLLRPLNHCTNLKQWDLQDKHTHTHTHAHTCLAYLIYLTQSSSHVLQPDAPLL